MTDSIVCQHGAKAETFLQRNVRQKGRRMTRNIQTHFNVKTNAKSLFRQPYVVLISP